MINNIGLFPQTIQIDSQYMAHNHPYGQVPTESRSLLDCRESGTHLSHRQHGGKITKTVN